MATSARRHGAPLHPLLATLLTAVLAALAIGVSAGTANAANGYRYWNYFHVQDGKYVFAKTGAGDYTPKNGATEAYRYGTSTTSKGIPPRADLSKYDFAAICAGTKASSGQKRVAVILDYGTKADAPAGQTPPAPRTACAAVPAGANGQQVLASVAQVRAHPYTCGIDGYPASGCSVTVKNPTESAGSPVAFTLPKAAQAGTGTQSADSSGGTAAASGGAGPWPLVGVAAAVLVILLGAFALNRRRSA